MTLSKYTINALIASSRYMPLPARGLTTVIAIVFLGLNLLWLQSTAAAALNKPAIRFENPLFGLQAESHHLGGINAIAQDALGFIWVGSENGLGRFDGRTVKIYRADPQSPNSLPASYVRQIVVDLDGVLWATTEGGLVRYNGDTDDFTLVSEVGGVQVQGEAVSAVTVGGDNTLYFGAGPGLHVIDPSRETIDIYSPRSPLGVDANSAQIRDIEIDQFERVWLATAGDGVAIFDPQTERFQYLLHSPDDPNSLLHNSVSTILHDNKGRAWLGTYGGGLSRLDPQTGEFTQFVHDRDDSASLSSNIVTGIIQDSEGFIWAALDHGGLVRFDEQSQSFFRYPHSATDPSSPVSNQLRTVFEDRSGDLWLGAFPSGMSFYNRSTQIFRHHLHRANDPDSISSNAILRFKEASDGTVWVGTEGGLNALDPATGVFRQYLADPTNPHALNANPVLAIEEDVDGQLWIGTWSGGLQRFDPSTELFHRYLPDPATANSINSLFIWDIILDRKGRLWIATETGGLNLYRRDTDDFRHFVHNPTDSTSISGNFLQSLQEDQGGKIWVATFTGLDLFDPEKEQFEHIPYETGTAEATSSKSIKSLYEDSRGWIWAGTHYRGVSVFDPSRRTFTHLDVEDGLPSPNISSINEDLNGDVWLATNNGLAKITPDWQVTVYGRNEGVAGSNFNRDASLRSRAGLMYFGSSEGITVFDPSDLGKNETTFPVYITRLRILNQDVAIGAEGSPLSKSITHTDALVLDHQDTMFSFDFAALSYRNAGMLRYSYKLDGFDLDWHDVGEQSSATYTNLNPGDYRFRVRAAAGHGEWQEGQVLAVTITPPPWRTWWAYGLYGLMFSVVLYLRHSHVQLRNRAALYQSKSITDPLTGVFNRYGIAQVAEGIFANEQTKQGVCVMLLDIDHFKRINDRRGHDVGDRILQEVTSVAQQCIRHSDHFGRWGGEEFIVLCATHASDKSLELAETIRAAIDAHSYLRDSGEVHVTVSIGVADIRSEDSFESALKRADLALYRAKSLGRNCVVGQD